jgi:hypothetical protein
MGTSGVDWMIGETTGGAVRSGSDAPEGVAMGMFQFWTGAVHGIRRADDLVRPFTARPPAARR